MSAATPRKRPRSPLPIGDHLQDGLSAKLAALEAAGRAGTREEMKRQRTKPGDAARPASPATGAAPWPNPEPLPSGLPAVAPFALDLLPAALRPWIADIAERMQCPPDYPAVSAMVTLAAVVGRQMAIRPKCQDDWTVTPNLWGAVVGRPSLLKTPAIQEAVRMIDALEAKAKEVFDQENTNHEAALLVRKETAKEAIKRVSKAVQARDSSRAHAIALEALEEPPPPVRQRYKTHDATVEKLGDLLRENPRGMLLYRDELIGFLKSLDQDGREGSRAFYLEAWNGTGGFTFDRMGRGTVEIAGACVSIIGGIQPGPLGDYMVAAVRGGIGDDGLVQRFQLAVWPDAGRDWRNVDRWPDTDARNTARAVYERLDRIDAEAMHATREDGDALPWVRFDDTAQREFNVWRETLEHRLRGDDLHPCIESHLAKFRSLVPSLALLCHLADSPEGGPVGLASAHRAMAWAEYLETHARRIYAPAMAVDMAAAVELRRRLQDLPAPFTARDVYKRGWRFLDTKGTAAALAVLVEFGHIRAEDGAAQGRPTTRYTVHPSLLESPK